MGVSLPVGPFFLAFEEGRRTTNGWRKEDPMNRIGATIVIAALLAAAFGPDRSLAAPPDHTGLDLGTLPGGAQSSAADVNERGWVVGIAGVPSRYGLPFEDFHPFLWRDGVMTDLGALPGHRYSMAVAINDRGDVVGFSKTSDISDDAHALLWQNGATSDLGALPGDDSSEARAINNRGQVVGSSQGSYPVRSRAILWQEGTITELGELPGQDNSAALGINNRGEIVGCSWSSDPDSARHAVVWREGTITDLGGLPDGIPSCATKINDRGDILGYSVPHCPPGSFCTRPLLWRNGTMTDLGVAGIPFDINDCGVAVVAAFLTFTDRHTYLWEDGTITDLGTQMPVHGINNRSQLVGGGGLEHARLWNLPGGCGRGSDN
jgi:probable HAF family extracellular repeat protein